MAINTRFNPIPHKPSRDLNRLLKNVFEAADARQKQAKKRSLCPINEHFEPVFNAAAATQIVFQQSVKANLLKRCLTILLVAVSVPVAASDATHSILETKTLCTDAWYRVIEEKVLTADDQGHGPDIGSDEWKSVIEFKMGIRGTPDTPGRDSEAWCHHIHQMVQNHRNASTAIGNTVQISKPAGPSFPCDKTKTGSIEAIICDDERLSALDRKLAGIYATVSHKAKNEHRPLLKAEQSGWIKGRNDCRKADNKKECIKTEYLYRIAELQARYQLVPSIGPVHFICDNTLAKEVVATFFHTDPATLIAEYGNSVSLMFVQPSGSGARYQGRNESFWEHQGEALIIWGYEAPEMRCRKESAVN